MSTTLLLEVWEALTKIKEKEDKNKIFGLINKASTAFINKQYHIASVKYKAVYDLFLKLDPKDDYGNHHIMQYMQCASLLESNKLEDLRIALQTLLILEKNMGQSFPTVYYALGKILFKLYRFKASLDAISKGLAILDNGVYFSPFSVPMTSIIIPETVKDSLWIQLTTLKDEALKYRRPDAVCFMKKCCNYILPGYLPDNNIYFNDPAFQDAVSVICNKPTYPCILTFHSICWIFQKRKMNKVDKLSSEDIIGLECCTPNCKNNDVPSIITRIEIFDKNAELKVVIEKPNDLKRRTDSAIVRTDAFNKFDSDGIHKTMQNQYQCLMNDYNQLKGNMAMCCKERTEIKESMTLELEKKDLYIEKLAQEHETSITKLKTCMQQVSKYASENCKMLEENLVILRTAIKALIEEKVTSELNNKEMNETLKSLINDVKYFRDKLDEKNSEINTLQREFFEMKKCMIKKSLQYQFSSNRSILLLYIRECYIALEVLHNIDYIFQQKINFEICSDNADWLSALDMFSKMFIDQQAELSRLEELLKSEVEELDDAVLKLPDFPVHPKKSLGILVHEAFIYFHKQMSQIFRCTNEFTSQCQYQPLVINLPQCTMYSIERNMNREEEEEIICNKEDTCQNSPKKTVPAEENNTQSNSKKNKGYNTNEAKSLHHRKKTSPIKVTKMHTDNKNINIPDKQISSSSTKPMIANTSSDTTSSASENQNRKKKEDPTVSISKDVIRKESTLPLKSAWKTIPVHDKWKKTDEEIECTICMETLNITNKCAYTLTCQHSFHKTCINSWLKKNRSCPICRVYHLNHQEYPSLI